MRLGGAGRPNSCADALQQLGLAGGFRQLALQRLARVGFGVLAPPRASRRAAAPAISTLRPAFSVSASATSACSGSAVIDQHQRRRRLVVVELRDEGGQHLGGLLVPWRGPGRTRGCRCCGRRGRRTPARRSGRRSPGGDDVGIGQAGRVHHVAALHEGQRRGCGRARRRRVRTPASRRRCSISAASSCCTVPDLPARNAFAWATSLP